MVSSSSGVKARCSTWGDSWLHHRSLQDLPERPGIDLLMSDQFLGPCLSTSFCKASSSSGLHGPLIRSMSFRLTAIMILLCCCLMKEMRKGFSGLVIVVEHWVVRACLRFLISVRDRGWGNRFSGFHFYGFQRRL